MGLGTVGLVAAAILDFAVAVVAVGRRVWGVALPSRYPPVRWQRLLPLGRWWYGGGTYGYGGNYCKTR